MKKFKDILAWIIIAIVLIVILGALLSAVIVLAQWLFSAELGDVVWIFAMILGIYAIARIVSWAMNRVI
jgi:hypothetical protein